MCTDLLIKRLHLNDCLYFSRNIWNIFVPYPDILDGISYQVIAYGVVSSETNFFFDGNKLLLEPYLDVTIRELFINLIDFAVVLDGIVEISKMLKIIRTWFTLSCKLQLITWILFLLIFSDYVLQSLVAIVQIESQCCCIDGVTTCRAIAELFFSDIKPLMDLSSRFHGGKCNTSHNICRMKASN